MTAVVNFCRPVAAARSSRLCTCCGRTGSLQLSSLWAVGSGSESETLRPFTMRLALTFIVLAGAAAFGLTSSALRAAPAAKLNGHAIEGEWPAMERIAYRRCWWRHGERRCQRRADKRPRVDRYRHPSGGHETNLPPNLGWGL